MSDEIKAPPGTPLEAVQRAVQNGGHKATLMRQGDNFVLRVMLPDGERDLLFSKDGRAILDEAVVAKIRQVINAVLGQENEAIEGLESVRYDVERLGSCSDEDPCPGLLGLMQASCASHGGIVPVAKDPDAPHPDFIAYIPPTGHRGSTMLVLNFCPCCGRDLRKPVEAQTVFGDGTVSSLQ